MGTGEGIVVLVVAAHRRIEALSQLDRSRNGPAQHHTGAVENDRELGFRQQRRGAVDGVGIACRAANAHDLRQVDIDHLGPEVPRYVDLCRRRAAEGLFDYPVQHFGDPRRVAHFFLVADHVLEQRHLLDFLEAALTDGLVRGLRGHQQQRGVVPVGGLDRGDEVGDARAVLRDRHGHLTGRTAVTVRRHPGVTLVRTVPELDPSLREEVRDRHHGRADDPEGMLDSMHL
ncbi:MAG: Uncharacterised protein [Rhodospirillaceae bacterium]|nr:MAG: Uncharacterised protein [Rhodospirillaceae bacterium]